MAFNDNDVENEYIFDWNIENFSYCWQKKNERIESPVFAVRTLKEAEVTKWKLWLYPSGIGNVDFITCYLILEDHCEDMDPIEIEYTLVLLAPNNSILKSTNLLQHTFSKDKNWSFNELGSRNDVFNKGKDSIWSKNTMVFRCRMQRINKVIKNGHCIAITSIDVERRAFIWTLEDFCNVKHDDKTTLTVESVSGEHLITLELYLSGGQCSEERINIDIIASTENIKFITFVTRLSNSKQTLLDCVPQEFICHGIGKIGTCTSVLLKRELIENESLYSPNGVLSLHCECDFSTGRIFKKILFIGSGCTLAPSRYAIAHNENSVPQNNLHSNCVCLADDLQGLYNEGILSDTKLRTKTETFPAHRVVLSARSKVFRAMFTADMKEKATECVDIPDMDADTVRHMLRYMYTDKVDDLNWENASLLYEAADKYEILSLKDTCSSFLKASLSATKACEVLILADMHHDKDLKKAVQDYILKQKQIIFESSEWKRFMNENSKLAAETMFLIWKRGTS